MKQEAGEPSRHISPSFQFVSVTQSSFKRGKPRQHPAVRRHVMLDRHRRDTILAMEGPQVFRGRRSAAGNSKDAASVVGPDTGEVTGQIKKADTRGTLRDAIVKRQLELVKQHPAAWMLDPFGSFAAPVDTYKQAALEYFAKVMVPSTRPFDLVSQNKRTSAIISLYLSDDAAIDSFTAAMTIGRASDAYTSESGVHQVHQLDVTQHDPTLDTRLSLATTSNDARHGPSQALLRIGLAYMTRSMRKLNQQTRDLGLTVTDSVIATVLDILVCEILMGGTSAGETHCRGLCALITTRGGPDAVPSFLMDSVFLSDMHMAAMTHRRPSYPLLATHQSSLHTLLPQACRQYGLTPYRCDSFILNNNDRLTTARLDRAFYASLEQLQDIVNYTNTFGKSLATLPVELRKLYLSKTFAVEHCILSQIQPSSDGNEVQKFYIVATLLFIYTSIQKWKPHSPLVKILVQQLQTSLLSTMHQDLLLDNTKLNPNFLLWSLFLGAYASSGQLTTRRWFLTMINRVTTTDTDTTPLSRGWIDIRAGLMACYYIDSLFEGAFEEIWREAESMVVRGSGW